MSLKKHFSAANEPAWNVAFHCGFSGDAKAVLDFLTAEPDHTFTEFARGAATAMQEGRPENLQTMLMVLSTSEMAERYMAHKKEQITGEETPFFPVPTPEECHRSFLGRILLTAAGQGIDAEKIRDAVVKIPAARQQEILDEALIILCAQSENPPEKIRRMMSQLVSAGADINARGGNTITSAAALGNRHAIIVLHKFGADFTGWEKRSHSFIQFCEEQGDIDFEGPRQAMESWLDFVLETKASIAARKSPTFFPFRKKR